MRWSKEFNESTLHDVNNHFAIRVVYKKTMHVELFIPQYRIKSTLQDYIDSQPKRIELFFSSAPVFPIIVEELNQKNITDFERLELLIRRCPYLYGYRFNQRSK